MLPPNEQWDEFATTAKAVAFAKKSKINTVSESWMKKLVYRGCFSDRPVWCQLEGVTKAGTVITRIGDELHCINAQYLAEMQSAMPSGLMPLNYVVVDVETTGLSAKDTVIEIGAVKYENYEPIDTFSSLVHINQPLSSRIEKLTGITQEMLDYAPLLSDVMPAFLAFISNLPLLAHNAPFDKRFLVQAAEDCGLRLSNPFVNTITLAKKAYPYQHSYALGELSVVLKLNANQAHRALSDVLTTGELYQKCCEELLRKQSLITTNPMDEEEEEEV